MLLCAGYLLNKNNNNNNYSDNNNNSIELPKQILTYTTDYFHKSQQNANTQRFTYIRNVRKIPGVKNVTYQNIEYLNAEDNRW